MPLQHQLLAPFVGHWKVFCGSDGSDWRVGRDWKDWAVDKAEGDVHHFSSSSLKLWDKQKPHKYYGFYKATSHLELLRVARPKRRGGVSIARLH